MKRNIGVLATAPTRSGRVIPWARPHEGHDEPVTPNDTSPRKDVLDSAPGWREEHSSVSEAVVKAERTPDKPFSELQTDSARHFDGEQ
jgi:hypothetical protein